MNVRIAIYLAYFALNLPFIPDFSSILLVFPTFAFILYRLSLLNEHYVTLDDMFYFCYYLFFVIEPIQVIDHGTMISYGIESTFLYTSADVVLSSVCSFIFVVSFSFIMALLKRDNGPPHPVIISNSLNGYLALTNIALMSVFIVAKGGLTPVLASRNDADADAYGVLATTVLTLMVLDSLVVLTSYKLRRSGAVLALLATAPVIVCCNPFNVPRFVLISTYLPILLVLLRGRLSSFAFYASTFTGVIVVMPILNITSRAGSLTTAEGGSVGIGDLTPFRLQFIDVFDMMVYNIHYTATAGMTYGQKLIGDVLFFIPRSIWSWKPTLTGLDVGGQLYSLQIAGTDNLSMPVFGDGYRDFGLIGVAITGVLSAWLLSRTFYKNITTINGFPILQYIIFASIPILLRGPISAVVSIVFLQALFVYGLRLLLAERTVAASDVAERWVTSNPASDN